MVNHTILINKLRIYGISDATTNWFFDYLDNGIQHAKVNGVVSGRLITMCGVPQGFILRPLLFSLYINNILWFVYRTQLNSPRINEKYAVLRCVVLCRAVPCHAVPCCAMLCHAVPCRAMACHVMSRYVSPPTRDIVYMDSIVMESCFHTIHGVE